MFDNIFIWAQTIGLGAMMFNIITWQLKNPRHIILCNIPAASLWATQYMILGAPIGALMNIFSIFKDGALGFVKDSTVPYVIGVYLLLTLLFGFYFFNNWFDSLAILASTISNLALLKRDNRSLISRACVVSQVFWIIYNFTVGAWIGIICGVLVTISSIIGMYRHENWNLKRSPINLFKSLFILPPSTVKEVAHV